LWLVVVTGDSAEAALVRGRRGMVVVVEEYVCLLLVTPKSNVGKHRRSLWVSSPQQD
jgi:hypothetical protein